MAANTLMKLLVSLGVDSAELSKDLDAAESQSKKSASKIASNFSDVGKSLAKVGAGLTAGVTLPLVAVGGMAINAASDLNESMSKVDVVFGSSAQAIQDWSKTAATSMGITQQAALEAAGTYGNLFTALGLGQQDASKMSTSLVQLASDLASFNNANPEDVLNALRSGLSGEVEPLKKFGIAMNEVILKQKAMELGFGDNLQALTEAQKLQLRYAVIMEQTTTAQGDFARTSDGLANSTRILKAQFSDAAASLGTQLLPLAIQLVGAISSLVSWFSNLSSGGQKTILIVAGIAAAIGPLLTILGGISSALGVILPIIGAVAGVLSGPLLIAIVAIVAALALFKLAWDKNFLGIRDNIQKSIAFWKEIFSGFFAWLTGDNDAATAHFQKAWSILQEHFGGILNSIWNFVKNIFTNIKNFIGNAISSVVGSVKRLASSFGSLSLPKWLTPGSPTPLELGLLGINDALKKVNGEGLSLQATPGMMGGGNNSSMSVVVNNPAPEPATRSITRELKKLSYLGIGV